jgi:hypothetical protein
MRSERITYCLKLMNDTKEIVRCLDAKADGVALNWGGFRCVAVEWTESHPGNEAEATWRVVIENVSPSVHEFRKALTDGLAERGHSGIEVELSW